MSAPAAAPPHESSRFVSLFGGIRHYRREWLQRGAARSSSIAVDRP